MTSEHKILFTGTVGAGKTTAIASISEVDPIRTEVRNTDPTVRKLTTTVGLDYGEVTLDNGTRLRLYGTPGQKRFDFMWSILAQGALGLVILIDNRQPEALDDLSTYLEGFSGLIAQTACVIGVGRMASHPTPTLEDFSIRMQEHGVVCPVVAADAVNAEDVRRLLHLLLLQLETRAQIEETP